MSIQDENLKSINSLRSMTKLNGKPLNALSKEDYEKQLEKTAKEKERRRLRRIDTIKKDLDKLYREKEDCLALIDGQKHKVSEMKPASQYTDSDYICDYEYDISFSTYDSESYYVEVWPNGDMTKESVLGILIEHDSDNTSNVYWRLDTSRRLNDEDVWMYSEAGFEKSFKKIKELESELEGLQ